MPKTYYDSELTGAQIESALEAIHGVVTPSNNGKVLYIDNGQIKAASASRWGHGAVLEPLSVTANGDYTPPTGTDGFDSVHVAVPSATLTTKSIAQNGTYNASSDNADGYSSVIVNVPGGATVEPLEVTENGTYTPPSGVDGYAPVTVNVSGGGSLYKLMQTFGSTDYFGNATKSASFGDISGQTFSTSNGTFPKNPIIELTPQQWADLLSILTSGYDALLRCAYGLINSQPVCDIHIYQSGAVTYTQKANNFGFSYRTCASGTPIRYFGIGSDSKAICDIGTDDSGLIVLRPHWDFSQLLQTTISSASITDSFATALFLSSDYT